MTAMTAQALTAKRLQFMPFDSTPADSFSGIHFMPFFGGDVILDPPDGVL